LSNSLLQYLASSFSSTRVLSTELGRGVLSLCLCVQSVVAGTCLGVAGSAVFARRTFDVCIVDEASQVSLPAVLNPLFHCHRFVLVGDDKQLPPVVQSPQARFAVSFIYKCFKRLKVVCSFLCGTLHRTTEHHLPHGITQCYLPPDTVGERASP